jgi:hypothetical protein
MRRLAAISCFLLLLLAIGGRGLLFQLRLAELRQEMRTALAKGAAPDAVETFRIAFADSASWHWLEDGREFEWQGARYDVLSAKHEGAHIIMKVLADKKETALVTGFRKSEQENSGSAKSLLRLLQLPYVPPAIAEIGIPLFKKHTHTCFSRVRCCNLYRTVPTPPPQSLVCC